MKADNAAPHPDRAPAAGAAPPPSKVGLVAAALAEAAWLAAVAVVPIYFNPQTDRIFEEDKIPLLRSLALLAGAMFVVWSAEQGSRGRRGAELPWWRMPLLVPTLVLTAAYLLATASSVAPFISWHGGYLRGQGTYTWLANVMLFVAVAFLLRGRRAADRLVTMLVLASVPPALYALLQRVELDPLRWTAVSDRVSGTAGNPVFLAAHLIMVVPLTVSRIVEGWRERARGAGGDGSVVRLGAYLAVLAAQLAAIVASGSRGPLLALVVALAYQAALLGLCGRRRWLAPVALAGLAAGAAFVIALNQPIAALQPLRDSPHLRGLARIFDTDTGSVWVRASIWNAAAERVRAQPWRAVLGHGPETQAFVLLPALSPELLAAEPPALADRAHNQVFDTLLTVGAVGLLGELALFLVFSVSLLGWLGLLPAPARRRRAYGLAIAGGVVGTALAIIAAGGSLRYAGVGLPIGICAALLALIAALGSGRRAFAAAPADAPLLIALGAGVLAHFLEGQVGFAVAATRLCHWIYLGLAVAVAVRMGAARRSDGAAPPSESRLVLSPLAALILALLTAAFAQPEVSLGGHGGAIAALLGMTWLAGAVILVPTGRTARSAIALATYAAVSVGAWLFFAAVYVPLIAWPPSGRPALQVLATRAVVGPALIYGCTFLLVAWLASVLVRQGPWDVRARVGRRGPAAVTAVLLLAVGIAVVRTNLDRSRADALSRLGRVYERAGDWDAAGLVYEEALRWRPEEDRYAYNVGRTLIEKAHRLGNQTAAQDTTLGAAIAAMEEARRLNPLHPDYPRNLGRAHRYWAELTSDPARRAARRATARRYYGEAIQRSPNDPRLQQESATLE